MDSRSSRHGRSFADPLSSSLNLSAFELARGLGDLLFQRYPYFALPQLLHELTHQWSFNSAVGHAIVSLLFRAQRLQAVSADAEQVVLDYARADLLQQIMLPLAEGLALVAEHDLLPGPYESTARPLLATAPLVLFGLDNNAQPGAQYPHLANKLRAARGRAVHLDRKSSLLLEPIASAASPHAIGYLVLKSLQIQAARRDERLLDVDLFLQVAHGYFYDDWSLVDLLLDKHVSLDTLGTQLQNYMAQRLARFPDAVDPQAIDEFIQRSINATGKRERFAVEVSGLSHGFWVDSFERPSPNPGRDRLMRLMQDALDMEAINDDRLKTLIAVQLFMAGVANVVTIAAADMFGRTNQGAIFLTQSKESMLGACLPMKCTLEDKWEGWLRVVVVLPVERGVPVVVVFRGEEMVGELLLGHYQRQHPDNVLLKSFQMTLIDPEKRQHVAALLREVLGPYDDLLTPHRARIAESLDEVVYRKALCPLNDDVCILDALKNAEDHSLLEALNGDPKLAEAAARLSLAISGTPCLDDDLSAFELTTERLNHLLAPLFGTAPFARLYQSGPVVSLL